jgi:hypothetical protein
MAEHSIQVTAHVWRAAISSKSISTMIFLQKGTISSANNKKYAGAFQNEPPSPASHFIGVFVSNVNYSGEFEWSPVQSAFDKESRKSGAELA